MDKLGSGRVKAACDDSHVDSHGRLIERHPMDLVDDRDAIWRRRGIW